MRGGRGAGAPHLGAHGQRRGGYDPNQPRVPEGHRDGGQWTDDERWTSGRWLRERWARLREGLQFAAAERPPLDPRKLGLFLARKLIEAIYRELASWDLFGHHNRDDVTIAVTMMDGEAIGGTSSDYGDWRAIDHFEARALRAPSCGSTQNSRGRIVDKSRLMRFSMPRPTFYCVPHARMAGLSQVEPWRCLSTMRAVLAVKKCWAMSA
jgi:hypothetical protein